MLRVALIFDDRPRPETTGAYCLRALERLADVRHARPDTLDALKPNDFDLFLRIDDGLRYDVPDALRPLAYWAIDTHVDIEWAITCSRPCDLVFAAQRNGADRLRTAGIECATWLPLACDPSVHRAHDVSKQYDIAFVGNVFPGPRQDLLEKIRRRYPKSFIGQCYFEAMAAAYSAAWTSFNRSVADDVNMRVFEAIACGTLLLTNDLAANGQMEILRDGVHLATYSSADELFDKLDYYLTHDDVRRRIAERGRLEVIAKHTYAHRMATVLDVVAARSTVSASAPSPTPLNTRDPTYFDFARPELLQLIPTTARRVLDVGCGAGRLGESLKARQSAHVTGIELDPLAGGRARGRLDCVIIADIETWQFDFESGTFDCIVCGDVLEHLKRPEEFLACAREWLAQGGCLVASIPNVRNHSVVRHLLDGNWTYESAGLLDGTHLQFFTRRSIEDLFSFAGFSVEHLSAVPDPAHAAWRDAGRPTELRVGRLFIGNLPVEEIEDFYVYQYLVVARPVRTSKSALEVPQPRRGRGTLRSKAENGHGCSDRLPHFTQDFVRDFEECRLAGRPYAFVRFADGERAVCMGRPIAGCDGWSYDGRSSSFVAQLQAALRYNAPDYYIGISDGCCDAEARDWYLDQIDLPIEQVTFSNIFVNWNYRRFRQLDLAGCAVVASSGGDFRVPVNVFEEPFNLDALVEELTNVDRPILVAAGPASAIIIHRYWQRASNRQIILDVGSAIDEQTKRIRTRPYQQPGSRQAELVCRW